MNDLQKLAGKPSKPIQAAVARGVWGDTTLVLLSDGRLFQRDDNTEWFEVKGPWTK